MSHSTTIKFLSFDHPDATRLCEAQQLEIQDVRPKGPGIVATAANIPVFVVAYKNDIAVGCGGLRPLASQGLEGQAEIKRMYVVPAQRAHRGGNEGGQGKSVALVVLEALEQAARDRNWMVMKLETSKAMMSARNFYQKFGYVECEEIFGTYVGSENTVCYEKFLDGK
jgi:GNAT superfamily N-acetyltransferase